MQWHIDTPNKVIEYKTTFKAPITAIGLWLAPDGDQTKSDYDVKLYQLILN